MIVTNEFTKKKYNIHKEVSLSFSDKCYTIMSNYSIIWVYHKVI